MGASRSHFVAARQVASILKHLAPDAPMAPRYAHYM
jgi:hypothetical protein